MVLELEALHVRDSPVEGSDATWRTAFIVRWSILGGIILLLVLWLVGGHLHARRRVRQGKPPLFYHKVTFEAAQHFLINTRQFLAPSTPQADTALQNQFSFYKIESPGFVPSRIYAGEHFAEAMARIAMSLGAR